MAITETSTGSRVTSATEWSLPRAAAYSAASPQTAHGVYQLFVDTTSMTASDEVRIRIYEKVRAADTQEIVYTSNVVGLQTAVWVSPSLVLMNGWDMTVVAVSGTATVTWSIRQVA